MLRRYESIDFARTLARSLIMEARSYLGVLRDTPARARPRLHGRLLPGEGTLAALRHTEDGLDETTRQSLRQLPPWTSCCVAPAARGAFCSTTPGNECVQAPCGEAVAREEIIDGRSVAGGPRGRRCTAEAVLARAAALLRAWSAPASAPGAQRLRGGGAHQSGPVTPGRAGHRPRARGGPELQQPGVRPGPRRPRLAPRPRRRPAHPSHRGRGGHGGEQQRRRRAAAALGAGGGARGDRLARATGGDRRQRSASRTSCG